MATLTNKAQDGAKEVCIGDRRVVLQRIGRHYVVGVASGESAARAVLVTESKRAATALYRAIVSTERRQASNAIQEGER